MNEFPKYWKGAYNKRLGLAVMEQKAADANSQRVVAIMLPEAEAQWIADIIVAAADFVKHLNAENTRLREAAHGNKD